MNYSKQAIDIVITWVDGGDVELQKKRQAYLTEVIASDASSTTRFASNNEIYFAIASVLKYMPDAGTIYIVTDQQQPEFLARFAEEKICTEDKIQVIDHQILFKNYEHYLPTFNSLTIEAMLWNIPKLSSEFIYLNDDVFFNAPVNPTGCFENDQVVVYGHWKKTALIKAKYKFRKWLNRLNNKKLQPRFSIAQMLSAEMLGLNQYYALDHRPHFVKTDLLQTYFQKNANILDAQLAHKFRHIDQFLPTALANHLAIQQNKAILKSDIPIAYVKPNDDVDAFIQKLQDSSIQYGCIQSLDMMSEAQQNNIHQAMTNKFKNYLPQVIQNGAIK
ncbi:capsular polysaccharide biosynthesis protein [Acinetobacter sp. ANC 4558]|uniref:Stealth CR1 domain-containing protein n=1 Tax=Acinetobacter sp. ANC 4558 TaxID=1977876 RepID=UPI000A344EA2|nr:Stealth CR1 domain-containing protein [Acinetobacter sp. ANC 4558]OTG83211.1 capsular polysaccharide biosynthesis protein [Acinetobacter sp. ANC 4558]